jgi:hypothetical protein
MRYRIDGRYSAAYGDDAYTAQIILNAEDPAEAKG